MSLVACVWPDPDAPGTGTNRFARAERAVGMQVGPMHASTDKQLRSFAILPAAGRSRRMGRPKLLLPFGGSTVIEASIASWCASGVERTVVVVRREDRELADRCRAAGADVVLPATDPAEMKYSIATGLDHVRQQWHPAPNDAWLLAPADMPRLPTTLIDHLLAEFRTDPHSIVVPSANGRRGHPVAFPWTVAAEVQRLPADQGVNSLLTGHRVRQLAWPDPTVWEDLDTPEDYRRLSS